MKIPEGVSLVMLAGTYPSRGEINVFDISSPVKIDTLARKLIKLSVFKPDADIKSNIPDYDPVRNNTKKD